MNLDDQIMWYQGCETNTSYINTLNERNIIICQLK